MKWFLSTEEEIPNIESLLDVGRVDKSLENCFTAVKSFSRRQNWSLEIAENFVSTFKESTS